MLHEPARQAAAELLPARGADTPVGLRLVCHGGLRERCFALDALDGSLAVFAFLCARLEIRSERCNHCDEPPCVTCCPTGASHVAQPGNVVLVTHDKCIGCKACLASCPYDARFINPEGYADKCTFCHHRTSKGEDPACVAVCPTRCMHFGDLDDPSSDVSKLLASRKWHSLIPEAGTKPRIFYLTGD